MSAWEVTDIRPEILFKPVGKEIIYCLARQM